MLLKNLIKGNKKIQRHDASAIHAKSANTSLSQNENLNNLAEIAKLALADETNQNILLVMIATASEGLGLKPQSILNSLISIEDEKDLLDGTIPLTCLRAHIANWLFSGMPHISGKNQNNQL